MVLTRIGAAALLLVLLPPVRARAGDWDLSGEIALDKRFLFEQKGAPQFPIYHQAALQLQAFPADELEVKTSGRLRFYDHAVFYDVEGLGDPSQAFPVDLLLWECQVDIFGLMWERLDLRLGKQRIAWGTADRFNPTDNLNPDDLSDFLDFGQKVPSWAARADLYVVEDRLKLTGVWLPGPVPILLPRFADYPLRSPLQEAMGEDVMPPTMEMIVPPGPLGLPSYDLGHSMQALKIAGSLLEVDWSLSYFHGYDDVPIERSVGISLLSPQEIQVDATVDLPEIHVIGADFAGELLSVGWWIEAAVFFPEERTLAVTVPTLQGTETRETTILHSDPYTKLTAGLDYTFSWGTYLNLQYVHGLFAERGGELHDYFVVGARHEFLNGELMLTLGGMFETDGFEQVADNHGVSLSAELLWKPYDNIDLTVGHVLLAGRGQALFALMDDGDQTYVKAKVSF